MRTIPAQTTSTTKPRVSAPAMRSSTSRDDIRFRARRSKSDAPPARCSRICSERALMPSASTTPSGRWNGGRSASARVWLGKPRPTAASTTRRPDQLRGDEAVTAWRFEWRRDWDAVWSSGFLAQWAGLLEHSPHATVYHQPALVRAWAETHGRALDAAPQFALASNANGVWML